jgi:hypothetical protein
MKTTAWKGHWQTLTAGSAVRRQEDRFYLAKKMKTAGRCSKIIIATGGVNPSNLFQHSSKQDGPGAYAFWPTTPNESFNQGPFSATHYKSTKVRHLASFMHSDWTTRQAIEHHLPPAVTRNTNINLSNNTPKLFEVQT